MFIGFITGLLKTLPEKYGWPVLAITVIIIIGFCLFTEVSLQGSLSFCCYINTARGPSQENMINSPQGTQDKIRVDRKTTGTIMGPIICLVRLEFVWPLIILKSTQAFGKYIISLGLCWMFVSVWFSLFVLMSNIFFGLTVS